MHPLSSLTRIYRFNNQYLDRLSEGFSEADWYSRPGQTGSNAHWILGHLAVSRRGLLRGLGQELAPAHWEEGFRRGSQPRESGGPAAAELREDFQKTGELLCERLSAISSEEAARPYSRKFPDGSSDVGGAAHFLLFHESSHLGQIGLLRRILGKPGFA